MLARLKVYMSDSQLVETHEAENVLTIIAGANSQSGRGKAKRKAGARDNSIKTKTAVGRNLLLQDDLLFVTKQMCHKAVDRHHLII